MSQNYFLKDGIMWKTEYSFQKRRKKFWWIDIFSIIAPPDKKQHNKRR